MFPGTNCEVETARALRQAGFASTVLRWNEDPERIAASDGLVIAGGFSYEDRGRSGVVAAKSPVRAAVLALAEAGKPVLGICNGAQILVEMGLVPGFHPDHIEMALARNRRQANGQILGSGYYHAFIHLKASGRKSVWNDFEGTLRMPVAHGEGRFLVNDITLADLRANGQDCLVYTDADGNPARDFPDNPNGSLCALAGVSNPRGNVLAMMPHPERSIDGHQIFRSLQRFFEKNDQNAPADSHSPSSPPVFALAPPRTFLAELFVTLKITDNAEKTLELAACDLFNEPALRLRRAQHWGLDFEPASEEVLLRLIHSDEFFNDNKESVLVKWQNRWFRIESGRLQHADAPDFAQSFIAAEKDDVVGEEKSAQLKKHVGLTAAVSSGVYWGLSHPLDEAKLAASALFGNPISWELRRV